jgi:DNA-binding IclR family transcriptional regulator
MTKAVVEGEVKKRAGIQSVEIGMRVLEALADLGAPSPLAAVVRKCGLSPPQTHRYLASLAESGMVRQNSNGSYDLGPAALKLGMSALARIDIYKIADEEIGAYCAATGSTVLVAVLGPGGPTIVRWYVGRPPVVTSLAVGSVMSILHSATGQVFLAFRPEQETEGLVNAELERDPEFDRAKIEALRKKARADGMAEVGGTLIPGLYAKAFPILNLQGIAMLVATLVTTSGHSEKTSPDAARKLRKVCDKISSIVGGHPEKRD